MGRGVAFGKGCFKMIEGVWECKKRGEAEKNARKLKEASRSLQGGLGKDSARPKPRIEMRRHAF